ncbi:probable protein-tyrosine-phosphatase [Cephalotrichum gorgonifer]|uniref:Probable protein-tyrosine-phosphatase n=1 Tax=Cephalotrichum gorgonifer TaxID=2041049 RepID=A0AAE8N5J6_9PEZI|nr:probable protein-tyrosine-phosphatase [Cephalotrichum gorgonifer]
MPEKISVLFVCLGNICRSTMAEGVFQSVARKEPYTEFFDKIDSCGTAAYHVGDTPDYRTMMTLENNGITDYVHRGRQLQKADFDKFDYIFAMDRSNLIGVERVAQSKPGSKAKVMLWGEYAGGKKGPEIVEDPYYGGDRGFTTVYDQCRRFTANFLRDVVPGVEVPEKLA